VGILVLDNDAQGASAVKQILDSEGWRVRNVQDTNQLLAELKTGEWSLVIANVAITGIDSPSFITLRELASVAPEEGGRIRALYLVPETGGSQYIGHLEIGRMPYVVRPYHLHDFLEKVSDLLVEVKAIEAPLRQVRHEFGALRKKKKQAGRSNSMFASRDSFSYTEPTVELDISPVFLYSLARYLIPSSPCKESPPSRSNSVPCSLSSTHRRNPWNVRSSPPSSAAYWE
jgi:DNA-binding response OmpR family regulator